MRGEIGKAGSRLVSKRMSRKNNRPGEVSKQETGTVRITVQSCRTNKGSFVARLVTRGVGLHGKGVPGTELGEGLAQFPDTPAVRGVSAVCVSEPIVAESLASP